MLDVIAPIQSYLGYITRGLDVLTTDASVAGFLSLEQSFGKAGITDVFSRWDSVDQFGRVKIRAALDPKGADNGAAPDSNVPEGTSSWKPLAVPEGTSSSKPFAVPKPNKRRSHLLTEDELTESATRRIARSSEN